jgi:hypothetical protein
MKQIRRSPAQSWLYRTVLGIALASLFSDWSHEIATAMLPAFLGSFGMAAAWLGIIEGISGGLSSFAKLGSGFYTDGLPRRKPIALAGYLITALATASFGLAALTVCYSDVCDQGLSNLRESYWNNPLAGLFAVNHPWDAELID